MDKVNAVSKARFASVKPQNIGLHHGQVLRASLLCMEPAQQAQIKSDGERLYYVVTGTARVQAGDESVDLAAGEMVAFAPHRPHTLTSADDRRLVCLVIEGES